MICGTCEHENQQGAKFCAACGVPLTRRCPTCGAEPSPTARFCDQCGSALTGATSPPAPTPGTAVRKQVTALFADLAGSTAFAERVDPEAARASLAPYFEILQSTIEDHAGTVAKFTGDGVMALFGVPEVAEDDALRAVGAGLDLQRRFHTFAASILERHGVELGLRVGVNTGELVVGVDDVDLVGDVLNTAARLESACEPGRVLVGEETWRLTRSSIEYQVLGEVRVKGKAEPVATFQVVDDVDRRVDELTPFVGRAEELAALRMVLDEARARSVARLATVIGAPGVGKTRLAHELRAGSDARSFDLRFERRGSTTFTPIVDLLRELIGPSGDVARLVEGHPEADRLGPVLASFLGHGELRTTEESFWAVRRLLELVAADDQVIVVVDDVQWAEPLFWDLLDHVVEWTAAPVLLVALARPELRELRPELTQPGRRVTAALWLEGLDAETTRELAARLLGIDELPAELADRLPESTEGNPLFVRELVQMLVDDGVLARDGDRWRLTIDVDAIEVPPTILSLLASRVERLPDDEREVVELASVIGTEFDRGTLGAIAGSQVTGHLGAVIDRLRRKDLIEPSGAWAGDSPVYRFHHVLIRDAAYRRLLKGRRAELHERVGHHAETAGDDDELDVIVAHHYEQVHRYRCELGELDDATRSLAETAVSRLQSAAEQALAREDLPSAGNFALRALALVDDDSDHSRDELLLIGCEALLSSGDVDRGAPLVDELHVRSADPRIAAWSDCFRAQLWSLTDPDHVTDADALADAAADRLGALGDDAGVAKARLVRAGCLARLGRVGECEEELDLALAAARAAGDRRRTVAVLGAAPLAALWGPSPVARAGGRCLDVLRLLRITTASPAVEATSIRCQGMLEALRGRFDSARDKLDTSRTTARDLGLRQGLFETELFAGFVELWAGDPVAAEPHLRAAHEGLGRLGIGADAEQAGALLARALLVQGRVEEADELASHALETAGQNLQTAITSRSVLAEIRAAQGDHDVAARLVDEAVAIVERTDVTLDHALTLLSAARVAAAAGHRDRSRRVREAAQALLSSKGVTASLDASMPTIAADAAPHPGDRATIDRRFTNQAWDSMLRWDEARRRGDTEAVRAMYAPDFVSVSRIPIVGAAEGQLDRDAAIASTDAIFELVGADGRFSMELVAIRGDDLFLGRFVAEVGGTDWTGYGVHHIVDGRGRSAVWFGEDQLLDAVDELEDRWLAGERFDAETVASLRLYRRARRSLADGDLRELRALLSDDFVARDHRGVGMLGERTVDEWVATMAPTDQGAFVAVPAAQLASGPGGGVILNVVTVGDSSWGRGWTVYRCRDGQLTALDHFELDDPGAAMAHYEAHDADGHTPAAPDRTRLRNHAIELSRRLCEAVLAGDRERVAALLADDFSTSDRGRLANAAGFSGRDDDVEGFVDLALDIPTWGSDVGVWFDPIAVRGDRLALVRLVVQVDGTPFERLVVAETDDERMTHHANFDPDQLLDAVDELDDRWSVEVQPDEETAARLLLQRRLRRSLADWNPSELRACLTDDFAAVDHRQLGLGERSVDDWVESMKPTESGSWVAFPAELLAVNPRGGLVRMYAGVGDTWGRVLTVTQDRDGRTARLEHFDEDDLDAAWARYRELTRTETADPELTNRAGEMNARANEAVLAGDRVAYRACFADGFVARLHEGLRPRDEVADIDEYVGVMFDEGELFGWDREVIAVRGEDLCLIRLDVRAAMGAASVLLVSEISHGLIARSDWYAIDQLAEARDELDQRYLVSQGLPPDHWAVAHWHRSYATRPEEIAPILHPDLEFVDRRRFVQRRGGVIDVLAGADGGFWATDAWVPRILRASDRGAVLERVETAADQPGEIRNLLVLGFADDHTRWLDAFDSDDVDGALARYDEHVGRPGGASVTHVWLGTNPAWRTVERFHDAWERMDRDACASLLAEEFGFLEQVTSTTVGREVFLDGIFAPGLFQHRTFGPRTPVAVRGERLCLYRAIEHRGEEDGSAYWIFEVDDRGVATRLMRYDDAQLAEAIAELDRRYLGSLGFGDDHWIARQWPLLYSVDPDLQAPGFHPDFEYVDHRPLSFADTDVSGLVEIMRTLDVDVEIEAPAVDRLSERGMVFRRVERAVAGSHEKHFIAVLEFEDGLGRRFDVFDPDALDAALARYDELMAPPTREHVTNRADRAARASNLAARVWLSCADRFRNGETTVFVDAAAPRLVFAGRRRSAPHFDAGVDHLRATIEAWMAGGLDGGHGEIVAIRGDRLCLLRSWVVGEAGELEFLVVIEVDEEGAIVYHAVFDADQGVDALTDLDRRWLASGGRVDTVVERLSTLMSEGPFEEYADLFAPEFVCLDLRGPGFGRRNRDEHLASTEPLVGHIATHGVCEYLGVGDGVALVRTGLRSERDGPDRDLYLLVRHDGERFTSWEEYPVDARADALASYHDVLAGEDRRTEPLATRPPARDAARDVTNTAWEVARALLNAIGERDRARAGELLHDDFVASPRERLMAGAHDLDADLFLERVDEFVRSGDGYSAEHTLLAVRGDELCAVHSSYRFGEDVIEHVSVHDVRDGRVRHMTIHDAGDLLVALDELDERWGERGGPAWMIALSQAARRSFAVPGFDRELLPFAPDLVAVDHRLIGMGRRTLEEFLASSSVLTPADVVFPQFIAIEGDVSFCRVAITRHGDGFSWNLLHVSRGDEAGMHEIHVFDPEQFDEAQAWYEQMRSASRSAGDTRLVQWEIVVAGERDSAPAGSDGHPVDTAGRVPSNRAWEASESLTHAWRQRDREQAASVLTDDFVLTNHNPFLMVAPDDTSCGKSDYLDIAFADDLAGSMTGALTAVRGDDLCLFRMRITSASGDLTERLVLAERRNGGIARLDHFDPGQLREAQIELDRRWFTSLGLPADHPFFDQVVPAYDPSSAGISRMVGAGFEFVEHRRLGFPGGDLAQAMTNLDSQLAEVEIVVPRYLRLSDRTSLLERIERTLDGSAESGALVLCRFDDAGLLDHMELFDVADEARAVARHDEITADDVGRAPSNRAWEIAQAASRARTDGDHERFASMLTDDFVASSADPIMSTWGPGGVVDKSTYLEAASDPQFANESSTDDALVAVRGDVLCLMRTTITTPDGDVWERYLVVEVARELITRIDMFGHDQLCEAQVALDRRWVELGGPGRLTECVARISLALRRADAAALRACVADDFVAVDHRSLGLGERNAAQWVESLTTLGSGTQLIVIDVVDHDRDIGVFWNRMRQPQDGAEWDFVHVASVDRGVVSRMDIFGADQMSTAREVYRRLRSERRSRSVQATGRTTEDVTTADVTTTELPTELPTDTARRPLTNRAWEIACAANVAYLAGDRPAFLRLIDPSGPIEMRGRLSLVELATGRDFADVVLASRSAATQTRQHLELVAVRGEHLCLMLVDGWYDDDNLRYSLLVESDGDRMVGMVWFDDDQLDDAQLELDRRWLASIGYGDDHWLAGLWPAVYASHAAEVEGVLHPDFEYVEHRRLAYPSTDDAGFLQYFDVRGYQQLVVVPRVHRLSDRGAVVERIEIAVDEFGSVHTLFVTQVSDGLTKRMDVYELDDLDAALARYDELCADVHEGA